MRNRHITASESPQIRRFPSLGEEVISERLENGLSVILIPKPGFQKRFAFFAADYGGVDRRYRLGGNWIDTPAGVAHFLEHEMFDMEYGDAAVKLSEGGANTNAFTSSDITAYYFECTGMFFDNLAILLEFVSTPYFSKESVAKEQGIISQEILMCEDDPDYCVYYNLMKSLFSSNPIRDPVAGGVDSIMNITPEVLSDCHKAFYNPSNMVLCVAGDIRFSQLIQTARHILPKEKGDVPGRDYGHAETPAPREAYVSKAMDVGQSLFLAGCKSKPAGKGSEALKLDLTASLALEALAGHSSPLYIRLYGEDLISGDFSASFDHAAGTAYTMFGGESRDPKRVFENVKEEIKRLSQDGIDAALFERIKKAATGSYIRSLNSLEAVCVGAATGHFKGYDMFETPQLLKAISADDAAAFIRGALIPENMTMSEITPHK